MPQCDTRMYAAVKTWNPFRGCEFDCSYCGPSFQRQAKRQKQNCMQCYEDAPHEHPDRLMKIPGADIVFVCGNADISFARPEKDVDYPEPPMTKVKQLIKALKQARIKMKEKDMGR